MTRSEMNLTKRIDKENGSYRSKISTFGFTREEVQSQFREPFILRGYRRPYINATDCLKCALEPRCNETFNIWSHFVAFLLFIFNFYYNFSGEHSIWHPFAWPELSFAVGICGFCLMSTTAHMFNSISVKARQVCFFMDYAAISIYSVGAGQAFYFYTRPLDTDLPLLNKVEYFTIASLLVSITSTFICCVSRNRWKRTKYVARTLAFTLPFLVNTSPYLYRLFFADGPYDSVTDSLPLFQQHCYLYLLSALANITRFPECLFPGKFDFIGASHHYLHVFTSLGAAYQFNAIHKDMLTRKAMLMSSLPQPNGWNTLLPMGLGLLANITVSALFSITFKEEETIDNKKD